MIKQKRTGMLKHPRLTGAIKEKRYDHTNPEENWHIRKMLIHLRSF